MSTYVHEEIADQPAAWRAAARLATEHARDLPQDGERVAVVGCGTSWFVAQAYAALREASGHGETDAFVASEYPPARDYDRVVAITRSGTTTEVLTLLAGLHGRQRTVALTGDPTSPVRDVADATVPLAFADERSVVQTRFATSALSLLRAGLGHDVAALARAAEDALASPVPQEHLAAARYAVLGRGAGVGLAHEAALKLREAAQAWAESYPAMDYRHGPISVADFDGVVYVLGDDVPGLLDDVRRTGATVVHLDEDPQVALVRLQRLAVAVAERKGLDPDRPRHLTRAVVLDGAR